MKCQTALRQRFTHVKTRDLFSVANSTQMKVIGAIPGGSQDK